MIKIKYLVLIFLTIIIYTTTFATEYDVPKKPASVDVADIDLDGDLDVVVGHHYFNDWSGISILTNNSYGIFSLVDSFYYGGNHSSLFILNLDNNNSYDIITEYYDDIENTGLGIIFDFYDNLFENHYFLNDGSGNLKIGDIDSDDDVDVIFYCNPFLFWGYINNIGLGQFSSPEYYYLDYPPTALAVGDLNGDDREDILIFGGQKLDAWLNYETGLEYTNIIDFTYATRGSITDIDNDGDNDIITIVAIFPGAPIQVAIYSNNNGSFTLSYSKWIDEAMSYIFVSDLNNDNYPDIIYNCSLHYPNSDYEIFHTYILFNNQDGTFQDPVNYYTGICSHKSHSEDLDGNGWNDIITLNYDFYNPPPDTGTIHILFNDGIGNFVEEPQVGVEPQYPPISEVNLFIYPNPFNNQTTINFSIKEYGFVELKIYDIKGRLIKQVINQKIQGGEHNVTWNGKDNCNHVVASGVYLYQLTAGNRKSSIKKMLLLN